MRRSLILRADASPDIGVGHVMRCLALAQAWQAAGRRAVFVGAELPDALAERLRQEKCEWVRIPAVVGSSADMEATAQVAREEHAEWVVVDGYRFTPGYLESQRSTRVKLLVLDDMSHQDRYPADVVLNQNLSATRGLYAGKVESTTTLLLGVSHTLLRREFLDWRDGRREIPAVAKKILVTLGGSDPEDVTAKVVQAVAMLEVNAIEARVVVGGCCQHFDSLQSLVAEHRSFIRLERDVTDMPELMAWADVAVGAGGSTSWEMAFMGVPTLVLVLSEDQSAIAASLGRDGAAVNLGWHHQITAGQIASLLQKTLIDFEKRRELSASGRRLVDGLGVDRVVAAMDEKLK